jgi:spore maturation protein CgeB
MLPGIPTIRPFEAMACGIPLVTSRWDDVEGLFEAGADYVQVDSGEEMTAVLRELTHDEARRRALADNGLRTIHTRHTCAHRVDELLAILDSLVQTGSSARIVAEQPRTTQGASSGKGNVPPPP